MFGDAIPTGETISVCSRFHLPKFDIHFTTNSLVDFQYSIFNALFVVAFVSDRLSGAYQEPAESRHCYCTHRTRLQELRRTLLLLVRLINLSFGDFRDYF